MVNTSVSRDFTDCYDLEDDLDLEDDFSPHLTRNRVLSRDLDAHVAKIRRIIQIRAIALESVPIHLGLNRDGESVKHHCRKVVKALEEQGKAIVCGSPLMIWTSDKAPKPKNLFRVASSHQNLKVVVDPTLKETWKPSPRSKDAVAKQIREERDRVAAQEREQRRRQAKQMLKTPKPKQQNCSTQAITDRVQANRQELRERIVNAIATLEKIGNQFSISCVARVAGCWDETIRRGNPDLAQLIKLNPLYHERPKGSRKNPPSSEHSRRFVSEAIAALANGTFTASSVRAVIDFSGVSEHTFYKSITPEQKQQMKAAIARCKQQA